MNDNNKKTLGLLLIKNPIILIPLVFILIGTLLMFSVISFFMFYADEQNTNEGNFQQIACSQGELNEAMWETQFANAGAFTGKGDVFLRAAELNHIDPVLLAAIAFHETGRGTSNAVVNKNNPGGIMDASTGWSKLMVFPTLDDGINAMAANLYKNYIGMGLLTLTQIGNKYAPIGAENDPTGLNANWVPNVSKFVASFGGLTQNCSLIGFSDGFASPVVGTPNVTSGFGTRIDPITGVVAGHRGVDFSCKQGDPIMTVLDGVVAVAKWHKSWGNYVVVSHGDKHTLYAHMSAIDVSVGDNITQGTPIGACGSTGDSTGPHLHLEMHLGRIYGTLVDPLPYLQSGGQS